jgi:hypothetical protein
MTKALPIDALHAVTQIVTHANCADGTASAIILFDAFLRPNLKPIRFIRPGSDEHLSLSPAVGLLLCDIAPHPSRAAEFAASDVIVLDHHKHSQAVVEACPNGIFADADTEPGVSGAMLALRHVWDAAWDASTHRSKEHRKAALDFATLIGISDTGQRTHPRWREARALAAVLHLYPASSWMDRNGGIFGQSWWRERMALGEPLLAKQDRAVRSDHHGALRFRSPKGTRVLVVNSLSTLTDMQELEPDCDLIVGFIYTVDAGKPTMALSMRSSTRIDCGALAVSRGGGGHAQAAGFQHTLVDGDRDPYRFVREVVESFESTDPTR